MKLFLLLSVAVACLNAVQARGVYGMKREGPISGANGETSQEQIPDKPISGEAPNSGEAPISGEAPEIKEPNPEQPQPSQRMAGAPEIKVPNPEQPKPSQRMSGAPEIKVPNPEQPKPSQRMGGAPEIMVPNPEGCSGLGTWISGAPPIR